MKKALILMTILALIGSGAAWACGCCPPQESPPSGLVAFTNGACDCCPEIRSNLDQTKTFWRNFSFTTLVSLAQRIGPAGLVHTNFFGPSDLQGAFLRSSPPLSASSSPPLYLLNRIFRI